jgi:hypothetical protein
MESVYVMPDGTETCCACVYCHAPYVPHDARQATCGAAACTSRRREETRKARLASTPEAAQARRDAVKRWREANVSRVLAIKRERESKLRGGVIKAPYLLAAPVYAPHLPGGVCEIAFEPTPAHALAIENTRALHALLSTLRGKDHARSHPDVGLLVWPCRSGWAVYWHDRADAAAVAGSTVAGRLYRQEVTLRLGPLLKLRAPAVTRRGRHRVRLDAITPVVIRSNTDKGTTVRLVPTASSIRSALLALAHNRLGLKHLTPEHIPLDLVGQSTEQRSVEVGGHWGHVTENRGDRSPGVVRGWVGFVNVETNAVGRWLLEAAAKIGLGGRVGLGFGRVTVQEMT